MIRAVVFDLGHTLWDIGPQTGLLEQAYADMRVTLGRRLGRDDLPDAAVFQRAVRDVLHEAAELYFMDARRLDQPPSSTWVARACAKLGIELHADVLREITPPLFATEIDSLACGAGTLDAVEALAGRGYRLGCVTNTLADTAVIRAMLRRHGFEAYMRSVVVSADEGWRKPHPSLFEKALRELDVAPGEAVFVGDSPVHDIAGARSCGLWAVLTTQYVARPYPDDHPPPDAVIGHLRELPHVIERFDAGPVTPGEAVRS
jgi:HAD superfamily hydrolase (TIGR01662 family)